MIDVLLVLNIGSSTIKFALYDADDGTHELRGSLDHLESSPTFHITPGDAQAIAPPPHTPTSDLIAWLLTWIESHGYRPIAVGHRVVHGGKKFSAPLLVNNDVLSYLKGLCSLAPLHQPHNIAGITAIAAHRPSLPQVACFDTAFHRTQPRVAELFALPHALAEEGIIRYGFHGLSYEYIARHLSACSSAPTNSRVIVAHLGAGSSLCALKDGKSIATTMGFTALDGLPMATRTGAIDPGVLLYLMSEKKMSAADLETLLYKKSGLLGLSGISGDMRVLLASDSAAAREAVDLYCYQIARAIGSLAAALGGLDGLVFTAGIGEHAAPVRYAVCAASHWLGIEIDAELNAQNARIISTPQSAVTVMVIPTDEEAVIADATFSQMSLAASARQR